MIEAFSIISTVTSILYWLVSLLILAFITIYIIKRRKKKMNFTPFEEKNYSRKSSSIPIQLIIVNKGVKAQTVSLFNKNKHSHKDNFGNHEDIEISCANKEQDYIQLLNQISDRRVRTSLLRIQSTNTAQITQILGLYSSDANGANVSIPLITQSYFSANQFQSGILDIPIDLVIDNDFEIKATVLASTTWILSIFPSEGNCEISSMRRLMEMVLSGFGLEITEKKNKQESYSRYATMAMPVFTSVRGLEFPNDNKPNKLKQIWSKLINRFKKSK
jgi:hypothetical protein